MTNPNPHYPTTRYEVAARFPAGADQILGYIARKSTRGMLDFILFNDGAQEIVDGLPETVTVKREDGGFTVRDGAEIRVRFAFTGRTERDAATTAAAR